MKCYIYNYYFASNIKNTQHFNFTGITGQIFKQGLRIHHEDTSEKLRKSRMFFFRINRYETFLGHLYDILYPCLKKS